MSSEPEFHENLFCPACGSKDFFTMKKFGQKEKTSYLEYSKLFYDKKIDFFLELFFKYLPNSLINSLEVYDLGFKVFAMSQIV